MSSLFMSRRILTIVRKSLLEIGLLLVVAVASLANVELIVAQERERGGERDRDRGGDRERGGSRRFDPKDFVPRMDANGNGVLEPGEISDRSRYFLESAARDAGLDLTKGVPVQKMIEAMEKRNAARESGGGSSSGASPASGFGGASSGTSSGTSSGSRPSSGGSSPSGGFPGFGVASTAPRPPGFDVPPSTPGASSGRYDRRVIEYVDKMMVDYDLNKNGVLDKDEIEKAPWQSDPKESDLNRDGRLDREELNQRIAKRFGLAAASTSASSGSASRPGSSSSSGSSGGSSDAQRIRSYAEGLLRQYDANKNGVLDKDEWSNARSISKDTDANGDGTVTLDELTAKLGSYGKDEGRSSGSSSSTTATAGGTSSSGDRSRYSAGSSRSSDPKASTEKRSYRQRLATERLPKGLPDWFARNDADGDGQVVMAEYASLWSETKASEFAKFDLDGDGVITPRECLRAQEADLKKK
jgi:hypothetical protein